MGQLRDANWQSSVHGTVWRDKNRSGKGESGLFRRKAGKEKERMQQEVNRLCTAACCSLAYVKKWCVWNRLAE